MARIVQGQGKTSQSQTSGEASLLAFGAAMAIIVVIALAVLTFVMGH